MLARTGNMAEVYREFWRMQEIAEQVEPQMNRAVSNSASMEAEISEGASADWYLVHTSPGNDLKAMRYLARRRFGVFRPMQQRKQAHKEGQSIGGMEPCFPGWLFAYCWDIDKLRGRILSAPGVMGIFSNPVSLKPIAVPDEFVQRLRAEGWVYEEKLTHTAQESNRHQQKQAPRRPTKGERKRLDTLKKEVKRRGFEFEESAWAEINKLEPHERIAFMMHKLSPPGIGCTHLRA